MESKMRFSRSEGSLQVANFLKGLTQALVEGSLEGAVIPGALRSQLPELHRKLRDTPCPLGDGHETVAGIVATDWMVKDLLHPRYECCIGRTGAVLAPPNSRAPLSHLS